LILPIDGHVNHKPLPAFCAILKQIHQSYQHQLYFSNASFLELNYWRAGKRWNNWCKR